MFAFAAAQSLFDGVSNIYVISIATALLAVALALYFANFLKDDNEAAKQKQLNQHSDVEEDEAAATDLMNEIDDDEDDDEDTALLHGDGLVSKLKSARLKELEAQLTKDQLEMERRIEREQLAAIFDLLKKQESELNMREIDESELSAQLHLYR